MVLPGSYLQANSLSCSRHMITEGTERMNKHIRAIVILTVYENSQTCSAVKGSVTGCIMKHTQDTVIEGTRNE